MTSGPVPCSATCMRRPLVSIIRCVIAFMAPTEILSFPEPLRRDAKRAVEARGGVLPRDDHGELRDGVVVVVPLHAREQVVVDVAVGVRDGVGVLERDLLRVGEE